MGLFYGSGGKSDHNVYAVVGPANVLHFSVSTFLLSVLLYAYLKRATHRRNQKPLLQNNQERNNRNGTPSTPRRTCRSAKSCVGATNAMIDDELGNKLKNQPEHTHFFVKRIDRNMPFWSKLAPTVTANHRRQGPFNGWERAPKVHTVVLTLCAMLVGHALDWSQEFTHQSSLWHTAKHLQPSTQKLGRDHSGLFLIHCATRKKSYL